MHCWVPGIVFLVAIMVCNIGTVPVDQASEQSTASKEVKRRDTEDMDAIFSDEDKHKRSREGIMFGNQQNKPSGMVDDALVGLTGKKDLKADDLARKDNNTKTTDMTRENENRIADSDESDEDDVENSKEPSHDDQDDDQGNSFEGFQGGFDSRQSLEMPRDWNEISEQFLDRNIYRRRRRNVVRNEHNFRKRSLRAPLEDLMRFGNGARTKRDLPYDDDDVAGLLSLLAAAQLAKQRKQSSIHRGDYPYFEDTITEMGERPLLAYDDMGGAYGYLPMGDLERNSVYRDLDTFDDGQVSEIEDEDFGPFRMGIQVPDTRTRLQRRSYYPAGIDYNALGLPGQKRSRFDDRASVWGRLEEKRRRLLSTDEDGQDGDDDEDADAGDGEGDVTGEKLYSLGALLDGGRGKEAPPVATYRRLL